VRVVSGRRYSDADETTTASRMSAPLPDAWIEGVRAACLRAAEAILRLREAPLEVASKDDGSPVSAADRAASRILGEGLRALDPALPVICEEGGHDPGRARRFWLVDPLDGTREFLRGTDRFTVNVALVEDARACFGLILAPVGGACWWGGAGLGAWRDGQPIRTRAMPAEPRILLSPAEPREAPVLVALRERFPAATCDARAGALKFCELAEGRADLHPRSVPSCGWDSAAGQAIVEGAGGTVLAVGGRVLDYRGDRAGWLNPGFLAVGDARCDVRELMRPG
jgi:3'(2'), 5'-bisphosphate nucleotidase